MPLSAQFGRAKYIERTNWLVCLFDFVQHGRVTPGTWSIFFEVSIADTEYRPWWNKKQIVSN